MDFISYLSIILVLKWLEKTTFFRLILVFISIIIIQSVFIFEKMKRQSTNEFIVFNKGNSSMFGERIGSKITFFNSYFKKIIILYYFYLKNMLTNYSENEKEFFKKIIIDFDTRIDGREKLTMRNYEITEDVIPSCFSSLRLKLIDYDKEILITIKGELLKENNKTQENSNLTNESIILNIDSINKIEDIKKCIETIKLGKFFFYGYLSFHLVKYFFNSKKFSYSFINVLYVSIA